MNLSEINYWAVLVTTVLTMVIGFLWYSPVLFGNVWVRLINLKPEEMKPAAGPMIGTVVMTLLSSFVLAVFIELAGASTAGEGLAVAFLISLFLCAKIAINYFFEGRSFQLYVLTVGYHAIPTLIGGIVLAVWK